MMSSSGIDCPKFDDVFLGILQNCGKIEPFIDSVFNFLSRRTDFFRMMHKKDDKLGFPPGFAEKMLIKIFHKYQEEVLKKDPIYMRWKASGGKDNSEMWQEPKIQEVVGHEEVVQTTNDKFTDKSSCPLKEKNKTNVTAEQENNEKERNTCTKNNVEKTSSNSATNIENDCFNGGETDKYTWSQTISDIDLKVPVPSFVRKSKDISIDIQSNSVSISLKNDPPSDSELTLKVILAGKLKEKIKCDESLWSLVPGKHVEVNLEKFQHKWWEGVLEGDPEIERSSIDTTQHVHEFDEQTQGDIRKVMYDQRQKAMGKPTSDEQKTHSLLEKAWDAEGSPFKGTPFDPSSLDITT